MQKISLETFLRRFILPGKGVVSLEYEAYQPMAENELVAVAKDIRRKWPQVEHVVMQVGETVR